AVDVVDDTRRAGACREFHGMIEATGLGGVERDNLCCAFLDDLDHVVRVPCAFVGHDGNVDRPRHFREPLDALNRLLEIKEIVSLHTPEGFDRLSRRLIALIGIATQRNARAHGLANPPYHIDIAIRIDPDLDLDRADTFLRDQRDLALGIREVHQPDRMGDRDPASAGATQQAVNWKTALLASEIIGGKFDGCFRIGIAFDCAIHPRMQVDDFAGQTTLDGWRQMPRYDLHGRSRTFTEIATELPAPILECGRLAPSDSVAIVRYFDQDVAADGLGQACPFVLAPGRQSNMHGFDGRDRSPSHPPNPRESTL